MNAKRKCVGLMTAPKLPRKLPLGVYYADVYLHRKSVVGSNHEIPRLVKCRIVNFQNRHINQYTNCFTSSLRMCRDSGVPRSRVVDAIVDHQELVSIFSRHVAPSET